MSGYADRCALKESESTGATIRALYMFVTNILLLNLLIALFRYVIIYILLNEMTPTSYINNNGSLFLLISLVYCKTLTCMALCSRKVFCIHSGDCINYSRVIQKWISLRVAKILQVLFIKCLHCLSIESALDAVVDSDVFGRSGVRYNFDPSIENSPGVNIQWIFRWIVTLLSCWILIVLLNFDTFLSRNSTGRRYVDGSEFHVELWPKVRIQHWMVIPIAGHNSTLNYDSVSQFNVEFRPGVIIQHGIKTQGHNSTWNYDPGELSTWNPDPGSWFHVESWTGSHFIVELWP